jgi:HAE1 family hydrophobic/amphiphilic exporter-1
MDAARKRPEVGNIFTSFDPRYPQVKVDLDREKARKLGVPINEVFQALSAALGGGYVNDFNRFGRLFRVYVQAEAENRRKPDDIGQIYVRSSTTGTMIPLGTLVTVTSQAGTEITNRFNLLRSVEFTGCPAADTHPASLAALGRVLRECRTRWASSYSSLS